MDRAIQPCGMIGAPAAAHMRLNWLRGDSIATEIYLPMPAMPKANELKTHERLAGDEPAKGGSDRGFGVVFAGARCEMLADDALIATTTEALAAGEAVGWFQGRMEFGPRALGNRSILGDARSPTMQKTLNLKVKHRESFRPFAPSVLREDVADWFAVDRYSPYMLLTTEVRTNGASRRRNRGKRCSASTG